MFIAFTNFDKLKDVQHRGMHLRRNPNVKNLSEDLPFLILERGNGWVNHKNLPEGFRSAAAIVCFDFDHCTIDESLSQNLTDLLTEKYSPYSVVIYHTHQHDVINNLIRANCQRDSGHYNYLHRHIPNSKYEIVIDLLLDAPQADCSNNKFVHDKTKPLRTESIGNDYERVLDALQNGEPMKTLPPILSRHNEAYKRFLQEVGETYDQNKIDCDERWEKLKKTFKNDEYVETN